ncbi:hypothetical protein [Faecalispora anaeroviscerum]|uniref:hypothetical protein n=1 Tax=Faecalispora anaeroviscerum TaxID=2991836 RepID=UPI0024B98A1B|nr:hypothetical protein [Faecalispora anaeroviscerum]
MNEQDIKRSVERIQMNPALKGKVMNAALSPRQKHSAHRLQKVALCFGAILILMLGGFWGRPNPAAPSSNNQFSLVAVAAEQKNSVMKKGETIQLQTYSANYYAPRTLELPDGSEEWQIYNVFGIKCRGENIKSITYESNRLSFAKIVILSKKQVSDLEAIFQEIDDKKGDYYAKDYAIDPWAFDMTGTNPKNWDIPNYFNLEKYSKEDSTQVEWGYKTVGKSYTIAYEDQNDFGKQYGYKLASHVSDEALKKANTEWAKVTAGLNKEQLKQLVEDPSFKNPWQEFETSILAGMTSQMNGSTLRITVTFNDGSTQTRNVRLNADVDSFNLTATLLN